MKEPPPRDIDYWKALPVDNNVHNLTDFTDLLEKAPPNLLEEHVPHSKTLFSNVKRYVFKKNESKKKEDKREAKTTKPKDRKEFWMSNDNCKICAECHIPFYTLRRRHHCRLCGRIFCSKCCSEQINGREFRSELGESVYEGPIRVCVHCKHLNPAKPLFGVADLDYFCFLDLEQTAFEDDQSEECDEATATETILMKNDFSDQSLYATIQEDKMSELRPTLAQIFGEEEMLDDIDSPGISPREESTNRPTGTADTPTLSRHPSTAMSHVSDDTEFEERFDEEHAYVGKAANDSGFAELKLETDSEKKKNLQRLRRVYRHHLKYVIKTLVGEMNLDSAWEDIVLRNSVRVNDFIRFLPDDDHDIRHYVKVKRVAGGERFQTRLVRGVIFRHNVAHRKMKTHVENPRVLLLSCSIDAHKSNAYLANFDLLLRQEDEYTDLLVRRIKHANPNIVVVCGSVSRLAQRLLLQHGITLLVGVQQSHIARLARSLGVPVINSIDILTLLDQSKIIGSCGIFRTEYFEEDPFGKKGRETPLVFFEDCPRRLHATILLRGENRETLGNVKKLMRLGIHTAYNTELEVSYLNDRRAKMPDDWLERYEEIQKHNETVSKDDGGRRFLSSSPFVKRERHGRNRRRQSRKSKGLPDDHIPFQYHVIGPHVNTLRTGWNPFIPNPDNYLDQSLVLTHCRMSPKSQCFPPQAKLIDFYTKLDAQLGYFLKEQFSQAIQKQPCSGPKCKHSPFQHRLVYSLFDGRVTVSIHEFPEKNWHKIVDEQNKRIVMWSWCKVCNRVVTPALPLSDKTWKLSFGKFLEIAFFNHVPIGRSGDCSHSINNQIQHFALGGMIIACEYQRMKPYHACMHPELDFHKLREETFVYERAQLRKLSEVATAMFNTFLVKTSEMHERLTGKDLKELEAILEEVKIQHNTVLKRITGELEYVDETKSKFLAGWRGDFQESSIVSIPHIKLQMYTISQQWNEQLASLQASPVKSETKESLDTETVSPVSAQNSMSSLLNEPPVQVTVRDMFEGWAGEGTKDTHPLYEEARFLEPSNCCGCFNLPRCFQGQLIPVYANEPSSLIAYTLRSVEFMGYLNGITSEEMRSCRERNVPTLQALESKILNNYTSRRSDPEWVMKDLLAHIPAIPGKKKIRVFTDKEKYIEEAEKLEQPIESPYKDKIKLQFEDCGIFVDSLSSAPRRKTKHSKIFECHVFYPRQFEALREICCGGDENFMKSMMRCFSFFTTGGKSVSTFAQSMDGKYMLKFVPKNEFRMFIDNADYYFEHMARWHFKHYPSILVTILGVFQVTIKGAKEKARNKYVLVMPNVFYGRNVKNKFDLKGSTRGRYVEDENMDSERVFLDLNFLEYTDGFPLPLEDHSKHQLHKAIHNDTLFLSKSEIVDYSILCGICDDTNEIVLGIIDYLRIYDLDKLMETGFKSMAVWRPQPTVIRPEKYKRRFRSAMDKYFMAVPDRHTRRPVPNMDRTLDDDVCAHHIICSGRREFRA